MLFFDQNNALGQFQGFNNVTHEYRINNIARNGASQFDGSINFMIGSTSRLFVGSSGNIGVGTSAPAAKFHVAGNARMSGGLALDGVGLRANLTARGSASFVATGTVTVSSASSTVTGNGTQFLSELQVGDRVEVNGFSRPVTSIASNTTLTLSTTAGVDAAGAPLTVFPAVVRLDSATGIPQVLVTDQGNLQLGAVVSATPRLFVQQGNRFAGITTDNSVTRGNISVVTTGPQGTDVGAMIGLGGSRGSAIAMFAGVRGAKENSTVDNLRGYLGFYTVSDTGTFAERGRITSDGHFGLGTTAPADRLQVIGDIRVGTSGSNGCIKDFAGTGIAGTCSSDVRLKKDIVPFGSVLTQLAALRPVHYLWRSTEYPERRFGNGRSYGLIAQEVETVLPELVVTGEDGYKAVDYSKLPLLSVQAIKELRAENESLKRELQPLKARLTELERLMSELLSRR
jgi:hypothetical protein